MCKGKGKVLPITCLEGTERELGYSSIVPLTLILDGGGLSVPHLRDNTPGKDPLSIVQETGSPQG